MYCLVNATIDLCFLSGKLIYVYQNSFVVNNAIMFRNIAKVFGDDYLLGMASNLNTVELEFVFGMYNYIGGFAGNR